MARIFGGGYIWAWWWVGGAAITRSTEGAKVKSTLVEWIEEAGPLHGRKGLKTCDVRSKRPGTPRMRSRNDDESVQARDCRLIECRQVTCKREDSSQLSVKAEAITIRSP